MVLIKNCVTVTGGGEPVVLDNTQERILHILGEDNVGILGCEGGIDSAAPLQFLAPAAVEVQAAMIATAARAMVAPAAVDAQEEVLPEVWMEEVPEGLREGSVYALPKTSAIAQEPQKPKT
jgi:hypothetical protein